VILGIRFISRWIGKRPWVLLGDGGFASIDLVQACQKQGGHLISRLRLDARLYSKPNEFTRKSRGRKAMKGERIETFKSMLENKELVWQEAEVQWYGGQIKKIQYLSGVDLMYKAGKGTAQIRWVFVKDPEGILPPVPLFSSAAHHDPIFIIETFVLRFGIEVLFEESRAHLGMETQRQWSEKAIIRSTPLIFGLFSIVCLIALKLRETIVFSIQSSAWYSKDPDEATFSDVIAYVRRYCWASRYLVNSSFEGDMIKLEVNDFDFLIERLATSP
jgi:hypothetical protein